MVVSKYTVARMKRMLARGRLVEMQLGDVYVIEFKDRVALEHAFAGAQVDLRPIRTGLAHLVIPVRSRSPERALEWLAALLKGPAPHPAVSIQRVDAR